MKENYYNSKESVDEYIILAKDIDGNDLIEILKNYLPSKSLLLEIGSGPGTDFNILNKIYKVIGSDYSTEFLNRLISKYNKDKFLHLDAVTLLTDIKFDGIYSNKVLQHLTNEELEKTILRQTELLNKNGIVCHSFWKGEGEEMFKGLLVNYQTEKTLNKLFEKYFDILLLEEYTEFEKNDSLLLIAMRK